MSIDYKNLAKSLKNLGTLQTIPDEPCWENLNAAYEAAAGPRNETHEPFYVGELAPKVLEEYEAVSNGTSTVKSKKDNGKKSASAIDKLEKPAKEKKAKKSGKKKNLPETVDVEADVQKAKAKSKKKAADAAPAADASEAGPADADTKASDGASAKDTAEKVDAVEEAAKDTKTETAGVEGKAPPAPNADEDEADEEEK